jgi:tight adherence protein B
VAVVSGSPSLVAPTMAAASIGAVAGWLVSIAAASRRERRLLASLGTAVAALSAELRAGQSEPAALRAVAATTEPELAALLSGAGDVAAEAGDVARALRESDALSSLPAVVRSGLLRTAAAWAVSRDCGAPIASVLDRVEDDLRAHRRRNQQIDAQLAGPRATAVMLSLLPGLGVALGGAVGARPVAVLLGTPAGELALLVGVCLDAIGLLWTVRIVRAAGRSP